MAKDTYKVSSPDLNDDQERRDRFCKILEHYEEELGISSLDEEELEE